MQQIYIDSVGEVIMVDYLGWPWLDSTNPEEANIIGKYSRGGVRLCSPGSGSYIHVVLIF